ncbi:hypothetical protein FJZ31_12260 [Candidatus Poribacteria bacterium]|nr:hypothetical protein [Candidatus Poribacteria bacterium]
MITVGARKYGNPVLLKPNNSIARLKRIPFTEKTLEEKWLQELIHANPAILPVDEIEPIFAPLISIGREVPTDVGLIDNLYLSPQGYLTIVETKLWRNPEARREVVVQIIGYAKAVNRWSFRDLEERVRAYFLFLLFLLIKLFFLKEKFGYNKQYRESDYGIIDTLRSMEQIDEADEPSIIDAISRNIQRGRFLLLIAGDGIRESVETMVDFLNQTPQLHFTLALVELQVYKLDEAFWVIPQVVTRTREITRAIVRIEAKEIESVSVGIDTESSPYASS